MDLFRGPFFVPNVKRAESSGKLSALLLRGGVTPQLQASYMISFVTVCLKDIFEQGKNYPWPRPEVCPRCSHFKVHGHGCTARYFHGFSSCLYLKCYRCPNCGCVITLRPDTHFSRIRTGKEAIRLHLAQRLNEGRWPRSSLSPPTMRHWLTNLARQCVAHLSDSWKEGLLAGFDYLLAKGQIPVCRFI